MNAIDSENQNTPEPQGAPTHLQLTYCSFGYRALQAAPVAVAFIWTPFGPRSRRLKTALVRNSLEGLGRAAGI
jgi:hypothetical protein